MKKNDEFDVVIDDIGVNMEGIAHVNGQTVFVPFAIPGEKCRIRVINTKSKIAIAKVMEVYTPSVQRVQPQCKYFGKCGGCDCQHVQYQSQLAFKQQLVSLTLSKMLGQVQVQNVVPSQDFGYRNKVALPIVQTEQGTKVGMYRVGSHKIIDLDECIISKNFVTNLIKATKQYIQQFNLTGYNEVTNKGLLRHVVARTQNGQVLITLVTTNKHVPHINDYVAILLQYFDNFGLNINVNDQKTNVIFGGQFIPVYGEQQLNCVSHGIKYPVSAYSFMQVNDEIREKIYDFTLKNITNCDNVIDAYSGAGLLTAMLSTKCKHAYGIEIVADAVNNANQLITNNGITNVTNICGDSATELPKLIRTLNGSVSVVLDPPRKGCSDKVLQALNDNIVSKIVYISCNPATLARDLKVLTQKYKIMSITPFDMFPNTKHVETVVVLEDLWANINYIN